MSDPIARARRAFADEITTGIGAGKDEIAAAFASVAREDFLGKGPWLALTGAGYAETPSDDPLLVYQPIAIALDADRRINNGEPQLHARMLSAAAPQRGDRVVHVGTGTGYYTAILAELVGPSGSVDGYEIVEGVARRAIEALANRSNVRMHLSSGAVAAIPDADIIYVCAGASRPGAEWLNALKPGGRLVFPLTPAQGFGGILRVKRSRHPEARDLAASFVSPAMFIACEGLRGPEADDLTRAFSSMAMSDVKSLRTREPPDDTAWFAWRDDLWLSTKTIDEPA